MKYYEIIFCFEFLFLILEKMNKNVHLIAVEGSIGAGKSMFVEALAKEFQRKSMNHAVLPEPVQEWTQFGTSKENLLKKMYDSPNQFSFSFQLVALLTRCEQMSEQNSKLLLVERTILAQKYVFLPILKENNAITSTEYEVCNRFMTYLSEINNNKPSLIVYLQTQPEVAKARIQQRGRTEEENIQIEYLQRIHTKYENWLLSYPDVIIVNANEIEQVNPKDIFKQIVTKLKIKINY
jgi:deoxyadenosine/deoxycytidine kinase